MDKFNAVLRPISRMEHFWKTLDQVVYFNAVVNEEVLTLYKLCIRMTSQKDLPRSFIKKNVHTIHSFIYLLKTYISSHIYKSKSYSEMNGYGSGDSLRQIKTLMFDGKWH